MKWVNHNQFSEITEKNVGRYYSLFQHDLICTNKKCADCVGTVPLWKNESDIVNGRIQQIKCSYREQQLKELAAKNTASKAKIPPLFKDATYNKLPELHKDSINILDNYVKHFDHIQPRGLYLYSEKHGIGRTTVLWILLQNLLREGKLVNGFIIHTTSVFLDQLQKDIYTPKHLFTDHALNCGILMLDDFGQEKSNVGIMTKVAGILEERAWSNLPIILTSTIPMEEYVWEKPHEKSLYSKIKKATQTVLLYSDEPDNEAIED